MERIFFSRNGGTPFERLLGHNQATLEQWVSLERCIMSGGAFSAELKEEVRRTLAQLNGCEYCKAKGAPSAAIGDLRMETAVRMARMSVQQAHWSDETWRAVKAVFTDAEISELLALICFLTACQRFGALLDLAPACTI